MKINIRTFTLIEMLIVIVIIGILAAALVPRLQSVQARARDTKRKTDFKQLHSAFEIYKVDFNKYPIPKNNTSPTQTYDADHRVLSTQTQPWISGMNDYMTSLPIDPLNKGAIGSSRAYYPYETGNYVYAYSDAFNGGLTYDLTTQLENKTDPDRCGVKQYKYYWLAGGSFNWCGAYSPMIYEYSPDSNSY